MLLNGSILKPWSRPSSSDQNSAAASSLDYYSPEHLAPVQRSNTPLSAEVAMACQIGTRLSSLSVISRLKLIDELEECRKHEAADVRAKLAQISFRDLLRHRRAPRDCYPTDGDARGWSLREVNLRLTVIMFTATGHEIQTHIQSSHHKRDSPDIKTSDFAPPGQLY